MVKKVQFARNVSAKDAIKSEDKDTIYFTKESSIIMGGKVYGNTLEDEKKQYLDKLYEDYIKSLFTVSSAVSKSVVNPGTEVSITITIKNNGVSCSSDTDLIGTGFLSGVSFVEGNPGVYKASVQISSVGVYSSVITAVYSGITKTVSVQVSCYNNIVYGWSPEETITGISSLRDASSVGPKSTSTGEYTFTNSSTGYYYLLIPEGTSIAPSLMSSNPQGTEGPIPVFFEKQSITGYTVFRISDAQAPSTHTIKFM